MIELKNTRRSAAALKKFTEACADELDGGRPILIVLGDKTGVSAVCTPVSLEADWRRAIRDAICEWADEVKDVCHIRSAWPEFGEAKALCGNPSPMHHGGAAVATCKLCLERARDAGVHLSFSPEVMREVIQNMRVHGVEV